GDLINVPAGTRHWFDLCADRSIRAIRLFQDESGWTPHYVDHPINEQFQPVCWGPTDLPPQGPVTPAEAIGCPAPAAAASVRSAAASAISGQNHLLQRRRRSRLARFYCLTGRRAAEPFPFVEPNLPTIPVSEKEINNLHPHDPGESRRHEPFSAEPVVRSHR